MRVTVGAIAVLGLTVSVGVAQPPAPERAAGFGAPQALPSGDRSLVARGAEDFPTSPYLSSTPVPPSLGGSRLGPSGGPTWLGGSTEARVLPAAGTVPPAGAGSVTAYSSSSPDLPTDPAAQPSMIGRFKGLVSGDKQSAPKATPQPVMQPDQATAGTPFRGTGANGAPVYAGPPAYRWYGWGTVTPGANPLAPAGQYPKASANWYAITGATPGAFPVPVANPAHTVPGTEPPTYGLAARAQPVAQPFVPVSAQPPAQPPQGSSDRPDVSRFNPPSGSKFLPVPAPTFLPPPAPVPVSVPTITPPPVPQPAPVPPALVIPPPDLPVPVVSAPSVPVNPVVPKPEKTELVADPPALVPPAPRVATIPTVAPAPPIVPVPTVEPVKAPVAAKPVGVAPAPLPTSITENPPREEQRWQPNPEPTPPPPGTWAPSPGMAPLPTTPPVPQPANPSWQTGSAPVPQVVARGQINDDSPDPVVKLIKQVCQGRATDVEVRWTGAKKLSVCFEIRTAAEAQKLVNDISRRPELTAYQIEFCVLVK